MLASAAALLHSPRVQRAVSISLRRPRVRALDELLMRYGRSPGMAQQPPLRENTSHLMVSAWIVPTAYACASREGPQFTLERRRWDVRRTSVPSPAARSGDNHGLPGGRPLCEQRRNSRRRASKQSPTTGVVVSSGCPRPSHQ